MTGVKAGRFSEGNFKWLCQGQTGADSINLTMLFLTKTKRTYVIKTGSNRKKTRCMMLRRQTACAISNPACFIANALKVSYIFIQLLLFEL